MKKLLTLFDNHSEYEEFVGSTAFTTPNVSRCEEEKDVHYSQNPRPTAITFAESAISINIDDGTVELTPIIEPADVKNKSIFWKTNDTSIATVDGEGVVTPIKVGKCTVWAMTPDGKVSGRVKVECFKPIEQESISLNKNILYIPSGDTYQLEATILPPEASQEVTWTTSNPTAVSVDSNGLVTANETSGSSIITAASVQTPSLTATCAVEIDYGQVTGVTITYPTGDTVTLQVGSTRQLRWEITPSTALNKSVEFQTNNGKVVTCDAYGLMTAVGAGETTISVISLDTHVSDSITVIVE